jgi:hypothetical protein
MCNYGGIYSFVLHNVCIPLHADLIGIILTLRQQRATAYHAAVLGNEA